MKFTLLIVGLICLHGVWAACPLEDDPTDLLRCIQIDISAIIAAARGATDLTAFCALASRYLECFKTYTRGCVGYFLADGAFTEIQLIAQYCCNGIESSLDCPFNPNVQRTCINSEANAIMADGSLKKIKSLEIGDQVRTLKDGEVSTTDVIMMMDLSDQKWNFLNITTNSDKHVSVSGNHLMSIPNGEFKFAKELFSGDSIITYETETGTQQEEIIKSIFIEPVKGYAAPLTMEGTLLVDNILVSNYALLKNHYVAHSVMAPIRWWYQMNYEMQGVMPSSVTSSLEIQKQSNGTHWFPGMMYALNTYTHLIKFY